MTVNPCCELVTDTRQGEILVVPGIGNRIPAFAVHLSPRALVTKIAAYVQA